MVVLCQLRDRPSIIRSAYLISIRGIDVIVEIALELLPLLGVRIRSTGNGLLWLVVVSCRIAINNLIEYGMVK